MEILGLSSIIGIIIVLYVFRANIKQFNRQAPEVVSNLMNTAVKGTEQIDSIISTNCAESELDCRLRMKVVVERIQSEELPSVQEAYEFIMSRKK